MPIPSVDTDIHEPGHGTEPDMTSLGSTVV